MLLRRDVFRLFLFAAQLMIWPAIAHAQGPRDCPPIPGQSPSLPDPPYKDQTPKAPDQITNQKRVHYDGPVEGAGYCLYMPSSVSDGLILFLHGFQFGREPGGYDPMVQYLVEQSGYYVVYPYGPDLLRTGTYPRRAIDALNDALAVLKSKGVNIQKLAVVGHSLGGATALRVAAEWKGPPPISLIIPIDPGPPPGSLEMGGLLLSRCDTTGCESWDMDEGLRSISCATRLLVLQADKTAQGTCVCPQGQTCVCQAFWERLPQIARYIGTSQTPQRNFLRVRDDKSHANPGPTIPSTHLGPTVAADPTASVCGLFADSELHYGCYLTYMDYWGYWRPVLAAVREAFSGAPVSPDYSPYCSSKGTSGTCATTRAMGTWQSDGKPATPMLNAADIPELVVNYPDHCPR
jgi:pimeloyl-ACP methyl ester carboxylesterase